MPYEVIAVSKQARFTYYYTVGNPFDRTIAGAVKVSWHGLNLERMTVMGAEGRRLRRKTHSRQINGMINAVHDHRRFSDALPASVEEWLHEGDSNDEDLTDEQAREKQIWGDVRDETPPINGKVVPIMREVELCLNYTGISSRSCGRYGLPISYMSIWGLEWGFP